MRHRYLALAGALLVVTTAAACSSPANPGGSGQDAATAVPTPGSGYDLGITAVGGETEVNAPFAVRLRATNAGPDESLGIMTVKDVVHFPEIDVWDSGNPRAALNAYDPGRLAGGQEVSKKALLRFITPGVIEVEAFIGPDEPPDRNPANNETSAQVVVKAPACTRERTTSIGAGMRVKDTPRRQVTCTGRGDDEITAGDQDVVRSKGGDDLVVCKEAFCVLELGPGDDTARCLDACFVDGGSGRNTCPRGKLVIARNCGS